MIPKTLTDRIFRIGCMVDYNRLNLDMRTLKVDLEQLSMEAMEEGRRQAEGKDNNLTPNKKSQWVDGSL